MNLKKYILVIAVIAILFSSIGYLNAADVDVVRDFDNVTIYHTVKSDSGSQAVYGLENNAQLQSRDGKLMKNGIVVTDDGEYNYKYLVDEDNNVLSSSDRVKFNVNRNLTAVYDFTPYKFVRIDILDYHGHSGGSVTYPGMKSVGDSVTHVFRGFTDVDVGFYPLYIIDLDNNQTFNPGDSVSFGYDDVDMRLLKTYQYVYGKDIVVENVIIENRTVYNDTVIDRVIYNDTVIDRVIYNDTVVDRVIYNDTIVDRVIYNDTVIDRVIYNDTVIDRVIYNDTIVDRVIYNDTVIDRVIYNDTVIDRIIYNDTIVDRIIYNDTIIDRIIYNDTIIDRIIYNDTIVDRIIYNDIIIDKIVENIIPKFIIDGIVKPIQNNENNNGNNQNDNEKVPDNNKSNVNNTTININGENDTNTYKLDDPNITILKKTGNTIGLILLVLGFLILIQLYYRKE